MFGNVMTEIGDEGVGWQEPAPAEMRQNWQRAAPVVVRPAAPGDVPAMMALIQKEVQRGNLLPRSRRGVEETLDNWLVANGAWPSSSVSLLGCVNLFPYPSGLLEVRSLAVDDAAKGQGVGSRLVNALVEEAEHRGGRTLFALTRAVSFFEQLDFQVTARERFPEKIWNACRVCPLLDGCDEIAVVRTLGD